MPTYRVPRDIQTIANRAREYNLSLPLSRRASYAEGKPGRGMLTARRLISGKVDLEQIKVMAAWFARHGEAEKESEARKDRTSKAAIAWALWGGTPASRWVKRIIREARNAENN